MSSVMHPVGPEPTRTYWVRRAVIGALILVVLIVVIASIANAGGGASASADQSNPPNSLPTGPGGPLTPLPAETPTATSPGTSSSATTGSTGGPSSGAPTATSTGTASASSKATAQDTGSATMKPSATPTKAAPTVCDPAKLRATLTGTSSLKPKQKNTFALSLINGSGVTCFASIDAKNFELKIYSGTDRIWSTNDCAKLVPTKTAKLTAEQAMGWSMTWNGLRSAAGCGTRPETPRAGTYFATAQLKGAKPVQLRMILHG